MAKIFQQCCQNCLACVRGEPLKKRFSEKSFKFCFFLYIEQQFLASCFFFGYCSQENVYSRSPEDEFKKNWKTKFFLSLSYLQLIFPALRLRTELRGWGLSIFQCMRPVEPRGEEKKICKVNTLFVVFGHWVIEWKFVFELWVEKKIGKMSKLHSIRPEKRFEERFLLKKKLQPLIILNFRQKNSLFCDKLLAR